MRFVDEFDRARGLLRDRGWRPSAGKLEIVDSVRGVVEPVWVGQELYHPHPLGGWVSKEFGGQFDFMPYSGFRQSIASYTIRHNSTRFQIEPNGGNAYSTGVRVTVNRKAYAEWVVIGGSPRTTEVYGRKYNAVVANSTANADFLITLAASDIPAGRELWEKFVRMGADDYGVIDTFTFPYASQQFFNEYFFTQLGSAAATRVLGWSPSQQWDAEVTVFCNAYPSGNVGDVGLVVASDTYDGKDDGPAVTPVSAIELTSDTAGYLGINYTDAAGVSRILGANNGNALQPNSLRFPFTPPYDAVGIEYTYRVVFDAKTGVISALVNGVPCGFVTLPEVERARYVAMHQAGTNRLGGFGLNRNYDQNHFFSATRFASYGPAPMSGELRRTQNAFLGPPF